MRLSLRPYQVDAVTSIRSALRTSASVLFVLPTGGGKTVIFTYIADSAQERGNRVLIVAHRREIVDQISRALLGMGVRHGLILPGHTMTDNPVQVGMVQTVARRLDRMKAPKLIVVDEAHHSVAGQWRKLIDTFPEAKLLGVTATPERLDGKGLGDAFQTIVQGPQSRDLIANGFLSPFTYLAPPQKVDLSSTRSRMGDYAIDELAAMMDRAVITGDAVEHYRQHLNGRPAIAFCVTVDHAKHVAATFEAAGFRSASVDGSMTAEERRSRIAGLSSGHINVLTSCDLISEGVDVPVVSGAILLRPTKSLGMYLQQIGRCLRLKPDGAAAVILDHVGNVHRHGRPDEPREWSLDGRKKREGAPPVRTCSLCYATFSVGQPIECDRGSDCGMSSDAASAGREAPEQVDGNLIEMTDPFAWTEGIDIKTAKGAEWFDLLSRADAQTDRLKQIARIRGYRAGWVNHVLRARTAGGTGGSDFQAREFAA